MNELVQILQRGESAEAAADRVFHQLWQTLTLKGMRVTTLFHHCDEDGSGEIELVELRKGMDDLLGMKLSDADFAAVGKVADKDGSGDISVKELVRVVARGDKKRQAFRKEYEKKMKVNELKKNDPLRIKTPVTPESDDEEISDDKGRSLGYKVINGKIIRRTPSPVAGFDLMGVARYGPDNELNQPARRPTVWGTTNHLKIHKPPATRRKEWKKAVGRPDLWQLKLRQQNYVPEQILNAPNRSSNKVQVHSHRSRAIEAAAAAAKAYQDGPPSHGTMESTGKKSHMTLVEKTARSELFGKSELQGLAQEIREKKSAISPKAQLTRGSTVKDEAKSTSPTSNLEDISMMSGSSALPAGYSPGTSTTLSGPSGVGLHQMTHPGHRKMTDHMLQMSEPLYWRKRVKHPSARHRIRHLTTEPQLAYSCKLTPHNHLNGRKPQPPKNETNGRYHHQDHRKLTQHEEGHEGHIALEDASAMMARDQAAGLHERLKAKQRLNFARAIYLGEPAALKRAVIIQAQQEEEMKKQGEHYKPPEYFPVHPKIVPHHHPPKFGSKAYNKAQERSRRIALHTECSGYEQSKLNTEKKSKKVNYLRDKDAEIGYEEIKEFEKRQRTNGHEYEPTTGKDWHREHRFLNQVLQQHSKDPKFAQKFTQFRRDYKRKSKTILKRVQEKGFEYVRAMNKMHYRNLHATEEEDLTPSTARKRWKRGNVGAKIKVKGDKARTNALKQREARLLNLRNFSGFGRRHLEFISEQLYTSIIKMPQPPGKKLQPMQIMANAFDAIDEDLSGSIDSNEFSEAMMRLDLGLSREAVQELLDVIDNDGDGTLDKTEFLAAMKYVHQKLRRMTYAEDDD
jgi:Ca2+-binding EF-hand superfamily protein